MCAYRSVRRATVSDGAEQLRSVFACGVPPDGHVVSQQYVPGLLSLGGMFHALGEYGGECITNEIDRLRGRVVTC
jgi:hypothetical protein